MLRNHNELVKIGSAMTRCSKHADHWDNPNDPKGSKFRKWFAEEHGIEILLLPNGLADGYKIVDEQKYMYFILMWA